MGWWQEKLGGKQVRLGDEPIDLLLEALQGVAKVYQENLGRKPTLEEFRVSLKQVLCADAGLSFEDTQTKAVRDVVFRTQKVAKRQPFAVGDYFAIPLEGGWYYGRILHANTCGHLVEIYALKTDRLMRLRQLLATQPKVVMNKHVPSRHAFQRGRWKIIGHEAIPSDFEYPAFFTGGPVAYGMYGLSRGDEGDFVTKEEAMKHEPKALFGPQRIEEALLKKKFERWPEIEACKKRTFGRDHEVGLRQLAEMGIPTTAPK